MSPTLRRCCRPIGPGPQRSVDALGERRRELDRLAGAEDRQGDLGSRIEIADRRGEIRVAGERDAVDLDDEIADLDTRVLRRRTGLDVGDDRATATVTARLDADTEVPLLVGTPPASSRSASISGRISPVPIAKPMLFAAVSESPEATAVLIPTT